MRKSMLVGVEAREGLVDRTCPVDLYIYCMGLSRPARALWIEIKLACISIINRSWVEAREGLVD